MPLKELQAHKNKIKSLDPLRGMKLERLLVPFGKLTDLEPLRGMPLTHLNVSVNYDIADASPLKGMKLTYLNLYATRVSDPTPLKGMPLESFRPGAIRDFSALSFDALKHIDLSEHPGPKDWSPLEKAALESYIGPVKTWPALAFLRTQRTTLQTVNRKPAVDFWKEADAEQAAYDEWLKKTTALKPPEQIEAVVAELVKRNPGLVKEEIARDWELSDDKSAVIAVNLRFNEMEDLSPLRALSRLEKLGCQMKSGSSKISDLWPLQGLKLQSLSVGGSVVIDLRPLTGMPLKSLAFTATPVADLTPLAGSSLTTLDLRNTQVADLTPLKGSTVRDLDLRGARVKDLSPLLEITVVNLDCDFVPERDAAILKKVKTLKTINKKPVVEALKSSEARTE